MVGMRIGKRDGAVCITYAGILGDWRQLETMLL